MAPCLVTRDLDVCAMLTPPNDRVASRAVDVELFGQRVRVLGIEDLIAAKEALGRDKDLITAQELRAILARREK